MIVDHTALSTFEACPAKYYLRIVKGYTPLRVEMPLSFGSVIHHALAEWYRTGDLVSSLEAIQQHWPAVVPDGDFRTKDYALRVVNGYINHYPKEAWSVLTGP